MATIKVMSWNIQNLGNSKVALPGQAMYKDPASPGQFIAEYVATVVKKKGIQILAILEVLGESGAQTAIYIQNALNTGSASNWQYKISSVQRHASRQERCIVFWDQSPNSGVLGLLDNQLNNPSACWTYSHVDDNSLSRFFTQTGLDRDKQIQCYNGLVRGGYLVDLVVAKDETKTVERVRNTKKHLEDVFVYMDPPDDDDDIGDIQPRKRRKTKQSRTAFVYESKDIMSAPLPETSFSYRVDGDMWNELKNNGGSVVLKDYNDEIITDLLTNEQLEQLKENLIQTDIVSFGESNERNPFLINFNISTNEGGTASFLLSVFHATNPDRVLNFGAENSQGTKMKFAAINNLAQCIPFQSSTIMLLGGDFNVTAQEGVNACNTWSFEKMTLEGQFGFWPRRRITLANPFVNISGGAVSAAALGMGDANAAKSSLKSIDSALNTYDSTHLTDTNYDYKNEAYDRFFFKTNNANVVANSSAVTDLVLSMNQAKNLDYDNDIAIAGVKFFKSRWNDAFLIAKINTIGSGWYSELFSESSLAQSASIAVVDTVSAKRNEIATIKNERRNIKSRKKLNRLENVLELIGQFDNPADTVPENQFIAYLVYSSISDHLPITAEIGLPKVNT